MTTVLEAQQDIKLSSRTAGPSAGPSTGISAGIAETASPVSVSRSAVLPRGGKPCSSDRLELNASVELETYLDRLPGSAGSSAALRAAPPRRIVLTGFMGAGKSTAGRLLAERLGWTFQDLDSLIEERAASTVPRIIERHGEAAFRRMESYALAVALGRPHLVLALGGGAIESITNRLLLEQTPGTFNIFLHAPLDTLLERCANQPDAVLRPFLADPAQAAARFKLRLPHYRRIARIILETTTLDAAATVALLMDELAKKVEMPGR